PAAAPVRDPRARALGPEVDARLLDARVPPVAAVVAPKRAEAHVELRERHEQARVLELVGLLRRRRAVPDAEPRLDLRLELDRLGLGRARRTQDERGDLPVEGELLEQERELAALVDLDGVVELLAVELLGAEAVDALQGAAAGEVEDVGALEER